MAGKRMIHANICESRKLSTISLAAETLYYRLLTRVDDDGNFTAEARIVLGQCAPMRKDWNETMITGLLEELATVSDTDKKPLIQFYAKGTDKFLHISRFEEFQYLRPDRAAYVKWPTHPPRMGTSLVAKRSTSGLPKEYQPQGEDKIREVKVNQSENQTEPETDDMSMKNRINEIAGKKIASAQNVADLEFLARKYGKETVIDDFTEFLQNNSGLDYPVSFYIKTADSRLQSVSQSAIILTDPRIREVVAFVYVLSQRAVNVSHIVKLLAEYTQEEIQDAFKAYIEPLDDNEVKWAPKSFFQDGAGAGIILARRQKKISDELQKQNEKASIEAGRIERKAAEQELLRKRREDDEAIERLGDMPF